MVGHKELANSSDEKYLLFPKLEDLCKCIRLIEAICQFRHIKQSTMFRVDKVECLLCLYICFATLNKSSCL